MRIVLFIFSILFLGILWGVAATLIFPQPIDMIFSFAGGLLIGEAGMRFAYRNNWI